MTSDTTLDHRIWKRHWYDASSLPKPGRGIFAVWSRNWLAFRQSIWTSVLWSVLEPTLYLVAIGLFLGRHIGSVSGVAYADFFFPALLSSTAMSHAFFETTYGSFTRMNYQKTFQSILLTPVTVDELVLGEILWGASRAFFGVVSVLIIATILGVGKLHLAVSALLVLGLACWMFSALGMIFSSLAKNYDYFVYVISGLIVPMSLFCDTYFPKETLPKWIQVLIHAAPLTPVVAAVRGLFLERWTDWHWGAVGLILAFCFVFTNIAIARLRRNLIR